MIFGAGNTAATLAGALSVPVTGYLLQATNSWPLVFGITAAHYVVGAALWAAWAGDRQLPEDTEEGLAAVEAKARAEEKGGWGKGKGGKPPQQPPPAYA